MKYEKVIVEIDEEGNVTVDASGFNGSDCLKATANFEDDLGSGKRTMKTEAETTKAPSKAVKVHFA